MIWNCSQSSMLSSLCFLPLLHGNVVLVAKDNMTTMHYINKQGGTHYLHVLYLSITLWKWCLTQHFYLLVMHIPSDQNNLADNLSRTQARTHDWELDHSVFLSITACWAIPGMDLFVSQTKAKCTQFCSRGGCDPASQAFTLRWRGVLLYLFPPLPLLHCMVVKLRRDNADGILITPWWPRQAWLALLIQMSADILSLPSVPHLLCQNDSSILYPDPQSLALPAWRI